MVDVPARDRWVPRPEVPQAPTGVFLNEDDYSIVGRLWAEYWGIAQYYLLADDVFRLHRLRWVMETSMLKTLAAKHRFTVARQKTAVLTDRLPTVPVYRTKELITSSVRVGEDLVHQDRWCEAQAATRRRVRRTG